jgi:hypothetical protein
MLRSGGVLRILFEFGGCAIDTRVFFRDYFHFLSALGYRIHRITPRGVLVPIPAYRESHERFRTTNFLAVLRKAPGQGGRP